MDMPDFKDKRCGAHLLSIVESHEGTERPCYSDTMPIRHKGMTKGCITDAPFIGTRINAIQCRYKCPGCFNNHLNDKPIQKTPLRDIINEVRKSYSLDEGIILGGLEWTNQPVEMCALITCALENNLEVMLYTHMTENEFPHVFPELTKLPIYVKFGGYKENSPEYYDEKYDVTLASENQYIKYYGEDL